MQLCSNSNVNMLLLTLAAVAAVSSAAPHYIALPADQIAFVDLRSLHLQEPTHIRTPRHVRTPRQNLEPPPLPQLPQGLYKRQEYIPALQQQTEYQIQEGNQYQVHDPQEYQAVPIAVQRYAPIPINLAPQQLVQQTQPEPPASDDASSSASTGETRPPDFGEYVDFGAHTGDNGAFGWYADYPINAYESHRK